MGTTTTTTPSKPAEADGIGLASVLLKNADGYGYKYTELADINRALFMQGFTYYQYIEVLEGVDYIMTVPCVIDDKGKVIETLSARRGCRVTEAKLSGKENPAQEAGSAITYARRYSLLMAFGLATEDDDGESFTKPKGSGAKRPSTTPASGGKIDFKEIREKVKEITDIEELNKLFKTLPQFALQYLTEDFTKRKKEILGDE